MDKIIGDDIFSVLSKLTIIIPLVVIVVALLIKFNNKTSNNSPTNNQSLIKLSPTTKPNQANSLKIDLIGPWQCNFNLNGSSISAVIKNKNIFVQKENNNIIDYYSFNNDCLYYWQAQKYSGDKHCGLSPIVSIIEAMTSFGGGLDLKILTDNLSQIGVDNSTVNHLKNIDLNKSCQKKEPPLNSFVIPTNILFKNIEITSTVKK